MKKQIITLAAVILGMSMVAAPAAVTVVAHYGMGEDELAAGASVGGTATTLIDDVGAAQNMTIAGGASIPIITDNPATAGTSVSMDFNGTAFYDSAANILGNISSGYLMEAWLNPASTTTTTANDIIFGDGNGAVGKVVFQNGNRWGIGIGGVTFTSGPANGVTPATWQHLALVRDPTYNSGLTTLLVDGVIYHSTGATAGATGDAGIGNQGAGGFEWDGYIDEVYFSTVANFDPAADLHIQPLPEPSTLAMLGIGAALVALRRHTQIAD